jgi:TolA-binding protein
VATLFTGASLCSVLFVSGCSSSGRTTQEENLYRVQKRLLDLERKVNEDVLGKQKREGARRQAQGDEKIDQLSNDLNMIRGDVDELRIGVTMGEMPGTPQGNDSLAKSVQALSVRLQEIEHRQLEMLELLDKAKAKGLAKQKEASLKTFAQVRKSFEEKKYQAITHSADVLLAGKALKPEERGEVKRYLAESHFALGKYRDAALEFNQLLVVPGMEIHLPEFKLRLGDCFRNLGDAKAALIFYREILRDHPQSKESSAAKAQVDKMDG